MGRVKLLAMKTPEQCSFTSIATIKDYEHCLPGKILERLVVSRKSWNEHERPNLKLFIYYFLVNPLSANLIKWSNTT